MTAPVFKVNNPDSRGFALVIVLGLIVLVVVLIIGFLSRATTERSAASGFAASVNARQLADVAVSIVQTQINDSTTQGAKVAWTSQPGMIRTFDASGELAKAYKLYSANNMISTSLSEQEDLPPGDWASNPGVWSDLNAPTTVNGATVFPIVDPAAASTDSGSNMPAVDGFKISSPPGATAYQPAPMPVRWLYILKDGTVVVPKPGGSTTVDGASTTNPIVGRVAFWTDDETCKININTAGGGVDASNTYWDTPRAYTNTDLNSYALKQPMQGEFQRYPGHPGTVMLSTALPGLSLKDYMSLTPRMAFGGSEGGTKLVDTLNTPISSPPKSERLYTSVDELAFAVRDSGNAPVREVRSILTPKVIDSRRFFLTAQSRAPEVNLFNLPRVCIWPVYKYDSGGNPITDYTTAFDRLIAFCSSTGGSSGMQFRPYFFQRQNAYSTTTDFGIQRNQQLYKYLQALTDTAIPGYGGKFSSKYSADRDQILTEIFDYIRCTNLNDDNLDIGKENPADTQVIKQINRGFYPGHRFTAGQRNDRDPNFAIVYPTQNGTDTWGMGRWPVPYQFLLVFSCNADGTDAPNTGSNNPSKNKMLSEPPFVINPSNLPPALKPDERRIQFGFIPQMFCVAGGWKQMFPMFQMEIKGLNKFSVNGQSMSLPTTATVDVTESSFRQSGGQNYGGALIPTYVPGYKVAPYPVDGVSPIPSSAQNYPFIGKPITISVANGNTLSFQGGTLTVTLYPMSLNSSGTGTIVDRNNPIQTLTVDVPNGTFPVPKLAYAGPAWSWYTQGYTDDPPPPPAPTPTPAGTPPPPTPTPTPYRGRINTPNGSNPPIFYSLNQPNSAVQDVVRAVHVPSGDYRLISGAPVVSAQAFAPHTDWNDTSKMVAATAINMGSTKAWNAMMGWQADGGSFVNGVTASRGMATFAMPTTTNNATATGDFDSGTSIYPDGPYINKPDEGTILQNPVDANTKISYNGKTVPYFGNFNSGSTDSSYFSPNRMIPSAVMFGSLPTGIKAGKPWQTLLFRPLAAAESAHKGANAPADNLLLDLFWMPVVQPYALSDRFSTAGKINMNYQILPFTYIERSTGVRAVLKSEKLAAIPNSQADIHVSPYAPPAGGVSNSDIRYDVDLDETLKQFTARFNDSNLIASGKNIFVSPSDICNLYMVPKGKGQSASTMASWWNGYRQTGDNLREKIYATVYPRLTTKSNTFTVYFRAQSLAKAPGTPSDKWQEGRDIVSGEYRGSTTIERYINPDAEIPDYAGNFSSLNSTQTLDSFYKWRTISNRQLTP